MTISRRDLLDASLVGAATLALRPIVGSAAARAQTPVASQPDTIFKASAIITMDETVPRAEAVAVSGGRVVAVGTLSECESALPSAQVVDLGSSVLMPGFIETHGHTLLSGMSTQPPATYIAPWLVPTWDDIVSLGKKTAAETPKDQSICFFGLDRLLHGHSFPDAKAMDEIFGDHLACMIALSQHQASVTTATLEKLGWVETPPENPVGGTYDRNADGSLTGIANEIPAVLPLIQPVFAALGGNPIQQSAMYAAEMAKVGLTTSSDIGYVGQMLPAYEILTTLPSAPLRFMMYEQTGEATADNPLQSNVDPTMLRKNGVKFWADGSPWLGSIATSFPYLDTEPVKNAGINNLDPGLSAMNYTKEQLDELLDKHAPTGWQIACHANGDLTLDMVLDSMEAALTKYDLLGTDHRWRLEHVGAATLAQLERMASLGIIPTIAVFQMMQWGDLLDGQMYESQYGARWSPTGDALKAGVRQSYHNDGNISRPNPLASARAAVTRMSNSGAVHDIAQAVPIDEALRAITINAAHIMLADDIMGSITPGKLADFVQLSTDPYDVEPVDLVDKVLVEATYLGGRKVDLDEFVAAAGEVDLPGSQGLRQRSPAGCGCGSTRVQML